MLDYGESYRYGQCYVKSIWICTVFIMAERNYVGTCYTVLPLLFFRIFRIVDMNRCLMVSFSILTGVRTAFDLKRTTVNKAFTVSSHAARLRRWGWKCMQLRTGLSVVMFSSSSPGDQLM